MATWTDGAGPAGPDQRADLGELITEAWLAQAPKTLVKAFLSNND